VRLGWSVDQSCRNESKSFESKITKIFVGIGVGILEFQLLNIQLIQYVMKSIQ
jgi:hypothetical protein